MKGLFFNIIYLTNPQPTPKTLTGEKTTVLIDGAQYLCTED
jgi:hypothetical protein